MKFEAKLLVIDEEEDSRIDSIINMIQQSSGMQVDDSFTRLLEVFRELDDKLLNPTCILRDDKGVIWAAFTSAGGNVELRPIDMEKCRVHSFAALNKEKEELEKKLKKLQKKKQEILLKEKALKHKLVLLIRHINTTMQMKVF